MDEQVYGRLAEAWTAFYKERYEEAIETTAALVKLSDERYRAVAVEAAHIQARSWWAGGGRAGRSRARRMWSRLEELSTLNSLLTRLKIARALEIEAACEGSGQDTASGGSSSRADDAPDLDEAIAILEEILRDRPMHTAAPEAGIDLARLYVRAGRFDDAEKTLRFVIEFVTDKRTLARMELPDAGLARPYLVSARAALKRLKNERNAGRAEFLAAEKLRRQGQWIQAVRAYRAVMREFPDTDYAPRSELHVGDCLVGLGQAERAVEHWRQFIEPLPAGPWRAQAYVKIIDLCLEQQLDLQTAGTYAALARSSLPAALADEKAGESWQAAAFDVQLRVGLVSFCEGRGAQAAEAFEAAKQLTSNKTTAERLDALIVAAKSGKHVIPEDCRVVGKAGHAAAGTPGRSAAKPGGEAGPTDQVSLALSMGVIHLLAGHNDKADAFFDRVLGAPAVPGKSGSPVRPARPPMQGSTFAQFAFAVFGRGAVLQARGRADEALEQFHLSLKTFRDGSWHDETLYRVATIVQDQAAVRFGSTSLTASAGASKSASSAGSRRAARPPAASKAEPLTAKQREAAAKAEEERLAALLKAKGEALPYWQELIKRYPKSPRVEQAMYNAGVLLCELAELADAAGSSGAESQAAWKEAAFMFRRFCERYPKSPWAGDAYVRQIDIALERLFDLDLAGTVARQGVEWADSLTESVPDAHGRSSPPSWYSPLPFPSTEAIGRSLCACYGRAAMVSYLADEKDRAVDLLQKALDLDRSARKKAGASTSADRMTAIVQGSLSPLTPDGLAADLKDDRQKTALLLADLALMIFDPSRAECIYSRLLSTRSSFPSPTAELEAYLLLRLGQSMQFQGRHDDAAHVLNRLYNHRYEGYDWTADGIYRLGTWTFNRSQDYTQAVKHWRHVVSNYTAHKEAERSLFFIAYLADIQQQDYATAVRAYETYLIRYPEGRWSARISGTLLPRARSILGAH